MAGSGVIPTRDRKWGLRPAHHVFELVFLVVGTLVAAPLVAGAIPAPDSTASFVPPGLLQVWAWMLLAGSLTGLLGLLWAGRVVTGMVLERVGLIVLAGAVILHVAGTAATLAAPAIVPVSIAGAFGLACILRSLQVRTEIRDLVAVSATGRAEETGEQDMRDRYQAQDDETAREAAQETEGDVR